MKQGEMGVEGQVINLNKLAFERDSQNKLKILERAYQLTLKYLVNMNLKVMTVINLSSFYCKESSEFRALCLLTDTLAELDEVQECFWEKALVLVNLAKVKAIIHSGSEAAKDLLRCLEYLKYVHCTDLNYFTVLVTAHYNLSIEYRNSRQFSQSLKHMSIAKALTVEHLGVGNKVAKLLSSTIKSSQASYEVSPYKIFSKCSSPESVRSKSSFKDETKGKIYKKFEKVSQSIDFAATRKQKSNKNNYSILKSPLEALDEEDEYFSTSYPKLTLDSSKSNKMASEFERERRVMSRDPDPEPLAKTLEKGRIGKRVVNRIEKKLTGVRYTREIVGKVVKIQRFIRGFLHKKRDTC